MTSARRKILIAGMGTSPAVLTNAVWALAHGEKQVVPDEIVVFITKNGKTLLKKELFDDGVWADMLKSLAREGIDIEGKLIFGETSIRSIPDARGNEIEDLRTGDDNLRAADFMLGELRKYTEDNGTELHVSIAALNKRYGKGKVFFARHAYARFGSLESRALLAWRLRRGSGRVVVEDEAQQALQMPHHPLGRVDDGEMIAF